MPNRLVYMISMSMLAVGMMSGGRMRTSTAIRKKTSGTAIFVESLLICAVSAS